MPDAKRYDDVAAAAWRWVLDQVSTDAEGPVLPEWVADGVPHDVPPEYRDGMYSGVAGLAHVLAEVRLMRPWTDEERDLADGIAGRLRRHVGTLEDATLFDGLGSTIGALVALEAPGVDDAVERLASLARPDGWPQTFVVPPRSLPDARMNDATLGTASVLLAALWARQHGTGAATDLAEHAVEVLVAEQECRANGVYWPFVPARFRTAEDKPMPNWSHGLAGIAGSLAAAGIELGRADLVELARLGAEHLATLGDDRDDGFVVPRQIPKPEGMDDVTFNWCHGPAGTSLLFAALDRAGADEIAGRTPREWERRCLRSLRTSGIPARLHPGFWDNDGRCCGTAGVGDVVLTAWQRCGDQEALDLAVDLADALVDRAVHDETHACWRFVEHRNADPLLPPGVGWMQGAAGIAAFLFRFARVLREGRGAAQVARMDTWWAVG